MSVQQDLELLKNKPHLYNKYLADRLAEGGSGGIPPGYNNANWDSTFTTVKTTSGSWGLGGGSDLSLIATASGNWNSTYTTVNSNSAVNWNYQGTDLKSLSGNWQSTYTTVNSNSGDWESAWSLVSGGITTDLGQIPTLSGNWNSVYTTVNVNSGSSWDNTLLINSVSGNLYTIVQDTSALTLIDANEYTDQQIQSLSSTTYTLVQQTTTALFDSTEIVSTSGNWNSTYTTVNLNSADYWDNTALSSRVDSLETNIEYLSSEIQSVSSLIFNLSSEISMFGSYILPFTNADLVGGVLTVTHGMQKAYVLASVYDETNSIVIPDNITILNNTQLNVDLNSFIPITGTWGIIIDAGGGVNSASDISEIASASGNWNSTYTTVNSNSAVWQNSLITTSLSEYYITENDNNRIFTYTGTTSANFYLPELTTSNIKYTITNLTSSVLFVYPSGAKIDDGDINAPFASMNTSGVNPYDFSSIDLLSVTTTRWIIPNQGRGVWVSMVSA